MEVSTRSTFFTLSGRLSGVCRKRPDSMVWRISCKNGTDLEKCFLHAVSEMLEILSACAAQARIRKEKPEQA